MASDDFVRGQSFRGFTVKKLSDFENELVEFVIALCFASQLPEVMSHIKAVAKKHTLLVPSVPVFGDNIFTKEFISENKKRLLRGVFAACGRVKPRGFPRYNFLSVQR